MRGLARRDRLTDRSTGLGGVLFALVIGVPASGFVPAHGTERRSGVVSAGGAGDERGDDVGGVPIQRLAAPVSHRRPRVGVTGCFLNVT
jgi:hypothetical protein